MQLNKIVKENKYHGLQLILNEKKYEAFSPKYKIKDTLVKTLYLIGPLKTLSLSLAYSTKKGDYWRNESNKVEYVKFKKESITLGKLYVSWNIFL